ncbi:response regulator transcription factor [Actinomadura flavalba]|uniref:response regulator transcription factor n=1 Tax=Actinomadura flavalba TaxID=1120938 RepID=UPI00039FDD38|nr:response regulator transcription factor [Actinomadura flavalba]
MPLRRTAGALPVRAVTDDPALRERLAGVPGVRLLGPGDADAPAVVLLDHTLPDASSRLARLTAAPDAPPVVVLTVGRADRHVVRALRAGAAGFLPRTLPPHAFTATLRAVAGGGQVLGPDGAPPAPASRARRLTGRDAEILACLGEGLSDTQIARCLHLPPATVKGHVAALIDHLGCADRAEAALIAYQTGL